MDNDHEISSTSDAASEALLAVLRALAPLDTAQRRCVLDAVAIVCRKGERTAESEVPRGE